MPEPTVHRSVAWLLKGIMDTPGYLSLEGGRLSFVSDDGVVFDEPLAEIPDLRFPWYYFSGGFKATIGGTKRRVSLTRPNNASDPLGSDVLGSAGELVSAVDSLRDAGKGRRSGKQWRALLTGPAATASQPG